MFVGVSCSVSWRFRMFGSPVSTAVRSSVRQTVSRTAQNVWFTCPQQQLVSTPLAPLPIRSVPAATVDAGISYEERVARRKEEIQSLQEALEVLNGKDVSARTTGLGPIGQGIAT